jgi:hypothetical protein
MNRKSAPALSTGDFVRIDWPNGSSLSGYVHVATNGVVTLKFGSDSQDMSRWLSLGFVERLSPFVTAGTLQVVSQGTLF